VKLKLIVEAKQIKTQNKAKQNKLKTKTNKMREVMSIHIGQAGCQMGNACWELCEFELFLLEMKSKRINVFSSSE